MKTNINTSLRYTTLGLLFSAAYVLVAYPVQSQAIPQTTVTGAEHIQNLEAPGSRRFALPEAQKKSDESYVLARAAAADFHAGNYAQAEAEARQSVSVNIFSAGVGQEVLAEALDAEGKDQEAFQVYHAMVVDQKALYPRVLLPYSLILLKSGQWEQSLAVYNQVASQFSYGDLKPVDGHFSADLPEPEALALAIHIEHGRLYNAGTDWAGEAQNTEAMTEYKKALQLAPDNALANYYYGVGWQKLSPTSGRSLVMPRKPKPRCRRRRGSAKAR